MINFIKNLFKKDDRISSKIADTVKQVNEKDKQLMAKESEVEEELNFNWPFNEEK